MMKANIKVVEGDIKALKTTEEAIGNAYMKDEDLKKMNLQLNQQNDQLKDLQRKMQQQKQQQVARGKVSEALKIAKVAQDVAEVQHKVTIKFGKGGDTVEQVKEEISKEQIRLTLKPM